MIIHSIKIINKYQGVFKDLSWSFVAQVIGNLLRLLLIFIVVRCYTQEEFGLWASITSIAAVIVTGDFGLTNVLRNIASKGLTQGEEGEKNTKEAWFSTFVSLLLFAIIGIVVLFLIKDLSVFSNLFKTDNYQLKDLGNWITVFVIGIFLVGLPFGLSNALFLSYGEVKEFAVFNIISGVLTFVVVISLSLIHVSIDVVSIAYFICPLLVSIVSTFFFLRRRMWHSFALSPKNIYKHMSNMVPTGLCFLGIDFSRNFIPSVLTIYSGALLGLSVAANINVATKIYTFFSGIMTGLLNPVWARLSKLFYGREYSKCIKMMKVNIVSILGCSLLIILGATLIRGFLVRIIAGEGYEADALVFLLIGACLFGRTIYDSSSLLLVATNNLRVILIGYIIFSLVALFVFPEVVRVFGFDWMMVAMIICWAFFIAAILSHTRLVLRRLEKDG